MSHGYLRLGGCFSSVLALVCACATVENIEGSEDNIPSAAGAKHDAGKTSDANSSGNQVVLDSSLAKQSDANGAGASSPSPSAADTGSASCGTTNACGSSFFLGKISGDTGYESTMGYGYQSTWYKLTISEDDHGLSSVPLWASVWLEPSPAAIFDLYLYDGCNSLIASSTDVASEHHISVQLPDVKGNDDTKDLFIEIRYRSGTCASSSNWSLHVEGNAQ